MWVRLKSESAYQVEILRFGLKPYSQPAKPRIIYIKYKPVYVETFPRGVNVYRHLELTPYYMTVNEIQWITLQYFLEEPTAWNPRTSAITQYITFSYSMESVILDIRYLK